MWLLSLLPLAVLFFFAFRAEPRPTPTPWGFLFPDRGGAGAPSPSRRRLILPLVLALLAFAALAVAAAQPHRKFPLLVRLEEAGVLESLSEQAKRAFFKTLAEYARARRQDRVIVQWSERETELEASDLAAFDPSRVTFQGIAHDFANYRGPCLQGGLASARWPEVDFLPYPVPEDLRRIAAVQWTGGHRYLVKLRRWDGPPYAPLRLLQGQRTLAGPDLLEGEESAVEVELEPAPLELRLDPGDTQPWTDRARWPEPDGGPCRFRAVGYAPSAGLRRALDEFRLAPRSSELLLTGSLTEFERSPGAAWLIAPDQPGTGFDLAPVPADAPRRLTTESSLPFPTRHALFDLRLRGLPEQHLVGNFSQVCARLAGRPVAAILAPGRLVSTIRPEDLADEENARDFCKLMLAGIFRPDLEAALAVHRCDLPRRPDPPSIRPPESPARTASRLLPCGLLLASLAAFAAALRLARKGWGVQLGR